MFCPFSFPMIYLYDDDMERVMSFSMMKRNTTLEFGRQRPANSVRDSLCFHKETPRFLFGFLHACFWKKLKDDGQLEAVRVSMMQWVSSMK